MMAKLRGAVFFLGLAGGVFAAASNVKASAEPVPVAKIYFVDVEGGQATLFVTSSGESLLIDTGWPGNDSRDAKRIVSVAKEAGLAKIDYVLLTHYHADHTGGVPQLVALMPVGTFIDHGPNRELDHGITEKDYAEYQKMLASSGAKHLVAHPGERLPFGSKDAGLDATVISADGEVIKDALSGGGQANQYCAESEVRPTDQTENARSLGIEVKFGGLKILDLGDLTWDKERTLMCPANKLGKVDILIVSHHGWSQSSSPALVDAIGARVAIMDNGAKKGGSTPTMKTLLSAPGLETLWQLHFSEEAGAAGNTQAKYIANPQGTDAGNYLELSVMKDGAFEVMNSGTGFTQRYGVK